LTDRCFQHVPAPFPCRYISGLSWSTVEAGTGIALRQRNNRRPAGPNQGCPAHGTFDITLLEG